MGPHTHKRLAAIVIRGIGTCREAQYSEDYQVPVHFLSHPIRKSSIFNRSGATFSGYLSRAPEYIKPVEKLTPAISRLCLGWPWGWRWCGRCRARKRAGYIYPVYPENVPGRLSAKYTRFKSSPHCIFDDTLDQLNDFCDGFFRARPSGRDSIGNSHLIRLRG
jgi:hypothetical protein